MNTEHTNQSRQAANAAFEQWWQRHGLEDPMDDEDRYYITASSWARRGYLAATGLATIKDSLTAEPQAQLVNPQLLAALKGVTLTQEQIEMGTTAGEEQHAAARQVIAAAEQAEPVANTHTNLITAADAALRYIAAIHGAEVALEPFSAAVTAQALASALHPYKTPHGREADSKMVKAISTTQLQADPAAVAVGKLRMLLAACNRIEEEAEEFEGPDGLVMGITMDHWHEFAEALTAARKALAASQQATTLPSAALANIAAERHRQIEQEGWTPEHDDAHRFGNMAFAAACYAIAGGNLAPSVQSETVAAIWPWTGWAWSWWKPKDKRRNLVKAGALIAAEIERLDRAAQKGGA